MPDETSGANAPRECGRLFENLNHLVIAGLDPAIPIRRARPCIMNRDGRDKPGHDEEMLFENRT
jgi:hypothetical protein